MLMSKSDTKRNNKLTITCEILPPGSLRRKRRQKETCQERWEDIVEICSEVIGEEEKNG